MEIICLAASQVLMQLQAQTVPQLVDATQTQTPHCELGGVGTFDHLTQACNKNNRIWNSFVLHRQESHL